MKEFEGKTAVITGAASGIGKALAKRFAQENMQVVLADIEEDVLEKTVEELRQYQHRVIGIKTDVLIEESVQELFIKAKEEYSGATVHFVNNEYDQGSIIIQKKIKVIKSETAADLAERVLKIEHLIYPEAIKIYLNRLKVD